MKNIFLILFITTIIIVTIFSITIISFGNNNDENITVKVDEELRYLDTRLIGMLNALNNISFSDTVELKQKSIELKDNKDNKEESNNEEKSNKTEYYMYSVENDNVLIQEENQIDWKYLKNTVEIIYSSWPTIMIDLHSLNIKNEDIYNFSNTLDQLVITIEKEDKIQTADNISNLYSMLPKYIEQYSNNSDNINLSYTKSHIIKSYTLLENDNWSGMNDEIKIAKEYFDNIMNSVNEKKNQINVSKTYIAINEMNNVINLQDKKLFYLKYINLMESIMQL